MAVSAEVAKKVIEISESEEWKTCDLFNVERRRVEAWGTKYEIESEILERKNQWLLKQNEK